MKDVPDVIETALKTFQISWQTWLQALLQVDGRTIRVRMIATLTTRYPSDSVGTLFPGTQDLEVLCRQIVIGAHLIAQYRLRHSEVFRLVAEHIEVPGERIAELAVIAMDEIGQRSTVKSGHFSKRVITADSTGVQCP